ALSFARKMTNYVIQHFYDESHAQFFYTSDIDAPLIARTRETDDNVIPSSNSTMGENLFLLGHYFAQNEWIAMAEKMLNSVIPLMEKHSAYYANWASLLMRFVYAPSEFVLAGKEAISRLHALRPGFRPDILWM